MVGFNRLFSICRIRFHLSSDELLREKSKTALLSKNKTLKDILIYILKELNYLHSPFEVL